MGRCWDDNGPTQATVIENNVTNVCRNGLDWRPNGSMITLLVNKVCGKIVVYNIVFNLLFHRKSVFNGFNFFQHLGYYTYRL